MSEGSQSLSLKHIHEHPLVFMEDDEQNDNGSENVDCTACGDPVVGSSYYGCIECKFFLHKTCTDLPPKISDHPLHEHTLDLQVEKITYDLSYCGLCFEEARSVYQCSSCEIALDVKCGFFLKSIEGAFSKLQHFSHDHPLIFIQRHKKKKSISCAACYKPTSGPIYSCLDCKFYLHKECSESLLPEITHPSHHKHSLKILAKPPVHKKGCSCHLCRNPGKGLIYHCSYCEFGIKSGHIFSSQSEKGTHEHPFILLSKPMTFVCDACGTDGDCIPYICAECNLAVHKECISLRETIRITRHDHPISHKYFLPDKEHTTRSWACKICNKEVNTEYGSYSCLDCKYIVHVKCAIDRYWLLEEGEYEPLGEILYSAVDVSATEIKHFCHEHNLIYGEEKIDDAYCSGCSLIISGPFYRCKNNCSFAVHKSCAKLPMKKRFWFAAHVFTLQEYRVFNCTLCKFKCTGFPYSFEPRKYMICLRCCAVPDILTHQGHDQHPLFYDYKYAGNCTACGSKSIYGFRCEECDFSITYQCISLPEKVHHYKYDEHPLRLTYKDESDPSQSYCDICEEQRDTRLWFYSCADCNFTAHPTCTLGEYPFMKGSIREVFFHPHPLKFVQKVYYYPLCKICVKPCLDAALECQEPNCNYIIHCDCYITIKNFFFPP